MVRLEGLHTGVPLAATGGLRLEFPYSVGAAVGAFDDGRVVGGQDRLRNRRPRTFDRIRVGESRFPLGNPKVIDQGICLQSS